MKFCEECVAQTAEACELVEKTNALGDVSVTADELGNLFNADPDAAQLALNCLFNREFNDCHGRKLYTGNIPKRGAQN